MYDVEQLRIDMEPLVALIQSGRRVNNLVQSVLSTPPDSQQHQSGSLAYDTGTNTSHSESTTMDSSAPQSNEPTSTLNYRGTRHRANVSDSTKDNPNDVEARFLVVCFPHHSMREMRQTKITEIRDHDLIRRIKKSYYVLRPFWRRLGELRGFANVRLARVSS